MIVRINLHPERKIKAKPTPYNNVGVVLAVLLVVEIIVGIIVYVRLDESVRELQRVERNLAVERDELKSQLSELDAIKKQIEETNNLNSVLAKLTVMRVGPQFVLNEFARLMSNPRDVVARKAATEQGWTLSWDPENVIINKFQDIGNSQVEITGVARTPNDVYELWTRIKTSPLLRAFQLGEIKGSRDSSLNIEIQPFSLTVEANFNYQTQSGLDLINDMLKSDESGDANAAEGAQKAPAAN